MTTHVQCGHDGRTRTDQPPRRKAVLFCAECGHESPPDGDWIQFVREGERTLHCPECDTVVIRPQ